MKPAKTPDSMPTAAPDNNHDFQLFETLRFEPTQGYYYLEPHCQRMQHSARTLSFHFQASYFIETLQDYAINLTQHSAYRVRLTLNSKGEMICNHTPLDEPFQSLAMAKTRPAKVVQCRETSIATDSRIHHKTTSQKIRGFYDDCHQLAMRDNHYDMVFINQQGFMTESTRANIVIARDGAYYTPPITDGCLPGVLRHVLLAQHIIQEHSLRLDDVTAECQLYLINSVRGWVPITLKPRVEPLENRTDNHI